MTLLITKTQINVDEFIANYGDEYHYELIDGEIIDMEPTGLHEQVTALISRKLNVEIERLNAPYFIPHRCLIKTLGLNSAFRPDIIVIDQQQLIKEPLSITEPVITFGTTVKLVVEVVSTNWQNDYARKYEDYEALGILEYWIVDYLGVGGKYYIGSPKKPTVTICHLINGEYQKIVLHKGDQIQSVIFPSLKFAVNLLFDIIN